MKTLRILGTRGIPGRHGGFETFATQLAQYLVQRQWQVTVYCQRDADPASLDDDAAWFEDEWNGVRRVHVPTGRDGPLAAVIYDWKCVRHARRTAGAILTLGYNTAAFSLLYRKSLGDHVMNMDGIEWRRAKWSLPIKCWFFLNEMLGCWLADHLVADNPHIKTHLQRWVSGDKISVLPYTGDEAPAADLSVVSHEAALRGLGLESGRFALLIARPEPENSVLELVAAYSQRPRGMPLIVLGNYQPELRDYHLAVQRAGGAEVVFAGGIYDPDVVVALRRHAAVYLHGHTVGGTNPSLVEALAAGTPVLAHDNCYNRWVAQDAAMYFRTLAEAAEGLDALLNMPASRKALSQSASRRFAEAFTPALVLGGYETLLTARVAAHAARYGDQPDALHGMLSPDAVEGPMLTPGQLD